MVLAPQPKAAAILEERPKPVEEPITYTKQINSMIDHFGELAVVQARPGVTDDPNFPPEMQVGIAPPQMDNDSPSLKVAADGRGGVSHGETAASRVDLSAVAKVQPFA